MCGWNAAGDKVQQLRGGVATRAASAAPEGYATEMGVWAACMCALTCMQCMYLTMPPNASMFIGAVGARWGLTHRDLIYHNLLRSFGLVTDEQRICISGDQA